MNKRTHPWTIHQLMTRSPVTVRRDTGVDELNRLFRAHDFGAFPVVDEHGGLCGIVTKLDLLRMIRPEGRRRLTGPRRLKGRRVGEIMSRGVVTVTPDDRAETAADLMIDHRLRNIPVVDRRNKGKTRVLGMLSRTDLLRCLAPVPNRVEAGVAGRGRANRGRGRANARHSTAGKRTARPK
jgi:CBS-domain-containing membrane protein